MLPNIAMILIGEILIYLAICKKVEPTLLIPLGFGSILVNIPGSVATEAIERLFSIGISNYELLPLLLFIGIGAMIDFEPLLTNPKLAIFGLMAQSGVFFVLWLAKIIGFAPNDAASIAIIGAADAPTSIFVAQSLNSKYTPAIIVAAYSYMALVPIIQPIIVRVFTTESERKIRMKQPVCHVSDRTKILFPIITTILSGIIAPESSALVGFLMFGNLVRVCGVLDRLSQTAQNELSNLITILLGVIISARMNAAEFLRVDTVIVLGLGFIAFTADIIFGVFSAKVANLFLKDKINPIIGSAGISAFPMAARMAHKMGQKEDKQNYLLMHAASANVAGQIFSAIIGGLIIRFVY